jgi:outer membrane protein assembly factor BamB
MLAASALIAVSCGLSPVSRPTKPAVTKTSVLTSPFPEQIHWTLELNNPLIGPGFVAYGGSAGYFPIAGDRIAAFDLLTGARQWMVPALPRSAPVFADSRLFIEEAGGLAALEARDGSVAWRIPLSDALAVPLASDHGRLVAATAAAVLTFRAGDGSLLWRHDLGSRPHGVPALSGDRIFVPVEDGRVMAFQADTGEMLWERRLGAAANDILASKDRLFVGSDDNYLYCLNAGNGEKAWRARTGADVVSRPTVDERRVYFVSLDNVLRALNRRNGVQQWKRSLPFRPAWPPIIVFDAVVVAGLVGPLRAFYLKDGTPAGEMSTGPDLLAGPLHAFESPAIVGPMLVAVTHNLAGDAKVTAVSRAFEPPVASTLPALPGAQPLTPTQPLTTTTP